MWNVAGSQVNQLIGRFDELHTSLWGPDCQLSDRKAAQQSVPPDRLRSKC